ncbi:MAG: hypothetical protein V3U18_00530 [Alphaproteobacteria bacterium]
MRDSLHNRPRRLRRTASRAAAVLVAFLLLSGCTVAQTAAVAGLSMVSFLETDKFLSDHIMSQATGMDCSTLNAIENGKFCKDEEVVVAVVAEPLYCYHTLAKVTCYASPSPYDSQSQLVVRPRESKSGEWLARRDIENEGH